WLLSGGKWPAVTTGGLDLPLIPRPQRPAERPAERILPEIERLCAVYEARGTRVGFYYMPSAGFPQELAKNQALLAGTERAFLEVARRHPRCSLVELELSEPLLE